MLVEGERARSLGLRPLARVISTAVAGVEPRVMGLGPIPATRRALERAGIGAGDLDLVELNEAFASQSLACIRELGLDPERVNIDGGAIALGPPLGMSGARLMTSLVHGLRRTGGRYGLATMCMGGQGIAARVERLAPRLRLEGTFLGVRDRAVGRRDGSRRPCVAGFRVPAPDA